MKTKTFILTSIMFVLLLMGSTGTYAQTAKSNLDQFKLMQQGLGTWQANVGKDTVQVRETQQYGKSFIQNVYYDIKGKKTPYYTNNFCIDSKEGNIKGFTLYASGEYLTWIALWTTEKKFHADIVQNFKPETVLYKVENVFESPTKMTWTNFNADGTKTGEFKYNKVK
jgi:hypothetical protein